MKNKASIMNRLYTKHTSYIVDMELKYNITFILGDSGTGKSAMFSFIEELATEDKRIRCFDYRSKNIRYSDSIKKSKGKVFVIDNADILLDDKLRKHIGQDVNNQYVIIGRNPTGLRLLSDNIYELISNQKDDRTVFSLKEVG